MSTNIKPVANGKLKRDNGVDTVAFGLSQLYVSHLVFRLVGARTNAVHADRMEGHSTSAAWSLQGNGGKNKRHYTPDELKAIDLGGEDMAAREQVLALIDIIRRHPAPPWFAAEPIEYGGRCVWWSTKCHEAILEARRARVRLDRLVITEEMKYYIGPNPLWREHHYLKIRLPNGAVFYADVYWLGGEDHIFFELPSSLVDERDYSVYLRRTLNAMDASMR
ncbi:MAG: hypothetical protein KatS3mg110_3499 [Pirellulaceae bacterium]|nr:MAG: hypothetical protein KatS3mg110_3499 [Pirellulaceae bacterium]